MHVYVCMKAPPNSWLFYMWPPFMYMYIHIHFHVYPVHICVQAGTHACICVCEGSSFVILFVAFLMYMYIRIFMCILDTYVCRYTCVSMCVCEGWRTSSGGIPLSAVHLLLDWVSEWPGTHQLGKNGRIVGFRAPPVSASSVMGLYETCHSLAFLHGF